MRQPQAGMCSLLGSNITAEHLDGSRESGVTIFTEPITILEKEHPARREDVSLNLCPLQSYALPGLQDLRHAVCIPGRRVPC